MLKDPVLILTGLSGAGKDSVAEALKAKGFTSAVPHTTRPMREGETEGNPYHFVSKDTYLGMLNDDEFVESNKYLTMFNGVEDWSYYGTSKDALNSNEKLMLTIGVQSALRTKEKLDNVIVVYLFVPDKVREERAKQRGSFDQVEWDNRLAQDIERRAKNKFPLHQMDAIIDNIQPLEKTIEDILDVYNLLNKETND
jgi:guanylate kinase